jgi:hypothetical protein
VIRSISSIKGQLAVRLPLGLLHELIEIFGDEMNHLEMLDGQSRLDPVFPRIEMCQR